MIQVPESEWQRRYILFAEKLIEKAQERHDSDNAVAVREHEREICAIRAVTQKRVEQRFRLEGMRSAIGRVVGGTVGHIKRRIGPYQERRGCAGESDRKMRRQVHEASGDCGEKPEAGDKELQGSNSDGEVHGCKWGIRETLPK
jgi:hypothetical protein